jgi:hypothetical protein
MAKAITVGDLIEALQRFEPSTPVLVAGPSQSGWDWSYHEGFLAELEEDDMNLNVVYLTGEGEEVFDGSEEEA